MTIEDASEGSRAGEGPNRETPHLTAPRPRKRDVNGWLVLDKPVGMTSTHAVAVAKRLFNAKKAGHAGTLDPLASGLLPIAFGEATKTVPFVMDGRKGYRFTVSWGEERDSDDSEGVVTATQRRSALAGLDRGCAFGLHRRHHADARPVFRRSRSPVSAPMISRGPARASSSRPAPCTSRGSRSSSIDSDTSVFEAACGKGTYVRAIARDLGRALGCFGHVSALRRTRVGPFSEKNAISLDDLTELRHKAAAGEGNLAGELLPVATALDDIPALAVSRADAGRLRRGQSILLRGRDAPLLQGRISVTSEGALVALAEAEGAEIRPTRIFNLSR